VNISNTQIDRLGDRLKGGSHTESDLRLLEDYRRSFGEAYEAVLRTIRQRGEFPTGRLAKSTRSIVEKLRRESIRLSQMQDIAGCRVVVANLVKQDQFVASLKTDFVGASVIDRRDNPNYGYRAVHIIAMFSGKPVEIQVRTSLQHLWAELSEKSSDVLDPTIKYGGGPDWWRSFLTDCSEAVASYEVFEKRYSEAVAAYEAFKKTAAERLERRPPDDEVQEIQKQLEDSKRRIEKLREDLVRLWNVNADGLAKVISWLDKVKGKKQ
jgi:putative GTP pyrophosphokinase